MSFLQKIREYSKGIVYKHLKLISIKMSEENSTNSEPAGLSNTSEGAISGYSTISDFTKHGFKVLMEGIKHSNSLPSGRDWNFYSAFESFASTVNEESHQIMTGISSVLKKNDVGANMRNQTLDKKTEILIDANDLILERVANNIDEMNGIRKTVNEPVILQTVSAQLPTNINGSWNRSSNANFSISTSVSKGMVSEGNRATTIRLLTAENIVRPQTFFKDKIDNRNDNPWEPRIKDKPNSLKPLAIFLEETELGREYSHPYEFELDRFTPSDEFLTTAEVVLPLAIESTPLVEINDTSQLVDLVEELRKHKIIAIDLEHHSYRSFMGITCLMQISTVHRDYLIDTLALRNDLWVLNEIFTKPDIIKVLHGADSDILWLQRDLSLYVVNMFDTYFGAKQLEYSGLSLAYLLNRFCDFIPNKKFQLADWRIRPLPDELKSYAREDTHYLIYIYQKMRNELIEKANGRDNLLKAVMDSSTQLCKKRYFKPLWHETAHMEFYSRCHRMFDNRQMFALKEIYRWRDQIARVQDESLMYVLPNNMLLEIAERLPKEMEGILACCRPVPPLVRANLLEIHEIILRALEKPFEEPILKEDIRARGSTNKVAKINVDSPLHCPHDLTKNQEFRDDLPTLLTSGNSKEIVKNMVSTESEVEQNESACSVFNLEKIEVEILNAAQEKLIKFRSGVKFLGPFERYKLVKPFIEAREKKLAEERSKKEEEDRKKREEKREEQKKASEAEPQMNDYEDSRTNEERIESIRQHFLQLARQPDKPASLLEMGGTKKRKRDESILRGVLHPDHQLPDNPPHTPIPNLKVTLRVDDDDKSTKVTLPNSSDQNRKRKSTEQDAGPSKLPKLSNREKNKLKMQKRKAKKALAIMKNEGSDIQHVTPDQDQQFSDHSTSNGRSKKNKHTSRGGKNFRGRGRNASNKFQSDRQQQVNQSDEFNAYDYSMVDFRQFQGGARDAQKPQQQFKSKFRGRGKPNKRGGKGQHNKSMSFGRGRGR